MGKLGKTCDQFIFGNPEVEVKGIAISWIATNKAIIEAAKKKLNLFITHEPIYPVRYAGNKCAERVISEKNELLNKTGMTVMRCHDTWDRMPIYGITDAWGKHLGLDTEPRETNSFYKIYITSEMTVKSLGLKTLDRVKCLGQDAVLVFGNLNKTVHRIAIGTGAITYFPSMYRLGIDAIIATDDGFNSTNGGLWAIELGVPIFVVNHATAEKPGMQEMRVCLKKHFPRIQIEYLDVQFPYSVII